MEKSSFGSLVADIFKARNSLPPEDILDQENEVVMVIRNNPFPKFTDKNILLSLEKETDVATILTYIHSIGFSYNFDTKFLVRFPNDFRSPSFSMYHKQVTIYCLYSFLQYMILLMQKDQIEDILIVASALIAMIQYDNNNMCSKAFVTLINFYTSNQTYKITKQLSITIENYFLTLKKLDIEGAMMLTQIANHIISTKNGFDNEEGEIYFQLLQKIGIQQDINVQPEWMPMIYGSFSLAFYQFNPNALNTFITLVKNHPLLSHEEIYPELSKYVVSSIINEYKEHSKALKLPAPIIESEINKNTSKNNKLDIPIYPKSNTFILPPKEELDKLINIDLLDKDIPYDNNIPENAVYTEKMYLVSLNENVDRLNYYVNQLASEASRNINSDYAAVYYSHFVSCINHIHTLNTKTNCIKLLLSSLIFDPSITIFNQNQFENFSNLSHIRSEAIKIIQYSPQDFFLYLTSQSKFLEYCIDLLIRFIRYADFSQISSNYFIKAYTQTIKSFQIQAYSQPSKEISIIRYLLNYIFDKCMAASNIAHHAFANSDFCMNYINLTYETDIRKEIFDKIYKFLKTEVNSYNHSVKKAKKQSHMIENIILNYSTIIISIKQLHSDIISQNIEEIAQYIIDLLDHLYNIIIHISFDVTVQKALSQSILKPLILFQNANVKFGQQIFFKIFKIIPSLRHFEIRKDDEKMLEEFIPLVFKDNLNEDLFIALIKVLIFDPNIDRKNLHIKIPETISIMYHVFFNNNATRLKLLEFTKDLCASSVENIELIHEMEIDLILLQEIMKFKNKEYYKKDEEILLKILDTFSTISSVCSSQGIAKLFISLFSPPQANKISIYEPHFLRTLRNLILPTYTNSGTSYYIGKIPKELTDHSYPAEGFSKCQKGFSISFWININYLAHNLNVDILEIKFNDGSWMKVSVTDNQIIYSQMTNSQNPSLVNFVTKLHNNEWYFIFIPFFMHNDHYLIQCFLNGDSDQNADKVKRLDLRNSTAEVIIPNINNDKYEIEIGKIFISKVVDFTEIMEFMKKKPCLDADTSDFLEVFSFPSNLCDFSTFKEQHYKSKYSDFAHILLKWNLDPLLPLYLILNMKMLNSQYYTKSLIEITNIFTKLLQINIDAQIQFRDSKSIQTISYLLNSSKSHIGKRVFSFSLYKAFYQMFFLMGDSQLKKQIFVDILTNLPLWSYSNEKELMNIMDFLNNKIYKIHDSEAIKYISFGKLFLRFKQLYDFISETGSPNRVSNDAKDHIVTHMISILKNTAEISFTQTDYDIIVVSAFESNDDHFTNNLLGLLKSIIQFLPSQNFSPKRAFLLSYILNKENPDFICQVLEIVYKIFSCGISERKFIEKSFYSILMSLSPRKLTNKVINQFINLSINNKEFFPIICWTIITLVDDNELKYNYSQKGILRTAKEKRDEYITKITRIHISSDYFDTDTRLIWPCLVFLLIEEDYLAFQLMEWILKVATWKDVLFTILLITGCMDDKRTVRIMGFITSHLSRISKPYTEEDISFYIYSVVFIFYGYEDSLIESDSPIGTKFFGKYLDSKVASLTSDDVFKQILCITKQLHFVIKHDPLKYDDKENNIFSSDKIDYRKKYVWTMLPLAKTILAQLINSSEKEMLKDIKLALIYYIQKFDPKYINSNQYYNSYYQTSFGKDKITLIGEVFENIYTKYVGQPFSTLYNTLISSLKEIVYFTRTEVEDIATSNMKKDEFNQTIENELETKNMQSKKSWSLLWSSLSNAGGPWDSDFFSSETKEKHYIRSSIATPLYHSPFLMRTNKHFVQHMSFQESLSKDKKQQEQNNNINKKGHQEDPDFIDITLHDESNSSFYLHEEKTKAKHFIIQIDHCSIIKPSKTIDAVFYLYKNRITLHYDQKVKTIPLSSIRELFIRTRKHIQTAIEIFTTSSSLFIDFAPMKNPLNIIEKIQQTISNLQFNTLLLYQKQSNFAKEFNSRQITEEWVQGRISTFKYLMFLNTFSGRSFNDISQYPIFPWILQNYNNKMLDINDISIYRDLSKPIGALNETRLNQLKENVELTDAEDGRFLYSSGPMSPLSVCVYLIRLEPFATGHIQLQGGHFDNPSRLFTSFSDTFRILNSLSHDYWEMVPEFFFLPESLVNENHFVLGDEEIPVDNVILPPWAKDNAQEFIYLHRKLLESQYVSQNINNWIDLIWGYKQKGKEAENANNTFLPALYDDIWNKEMDEAEIDITSHYLLLTGQIPPQLFTSKHPQRQMAQLPDTSRFSFEIDVSNIIACDMAEKSSKIIKFYLLLEDGKVVHIKYNQQTNQIIKNKTIADLKTPIIKASNPINKFIITYTKKSDQNENIISKISLSHPNANQKSFQTYDTKINTIFFSTQSTICIGTVDSSTEIHSLASFDNPIKVKYYRDSITCTASNATFDVVVNGTRDGALFITSLSTGKTIRVIDIGDVEVLCVNITPSWGFIVTSYKVKEQYFIAVYTINGKLIRKKQVTGKITIIESWSSPRDFDFIAFVIEPRQLFVCEAFYLNFDSNNHLQFLLTNIVMVRYSIISSRLFIVSANGKFQAIECRMKDLDIILP